MKAFYRKRSASISTTCQAGVGPTVQLAKGDPSLAGRVGDSNRAVARLGPIPIHPEDEATMQRELGTIHVEPPNYD